MATKISKSALTFIRMENMQTSKGRRTEGAPETRLFTGATRLDTRGFKSSKRVTGRMAKWVPLT